jgi:hypothetical protein
MRRRTLLALFACVGGTALATPAEAHLVTTGLGPFYDGITHLVVSPSDIMLVVGLALLAGLGGAERGRAVVATVPLAWIAGGLTGLLASQEVVLPLLVATILFTVGVLIAVNLSLPKGVAIFLALLTGGAFGALNGTALAAAGTGFLGLVGIVTAASVILFLLSAAAISATKPWRQIVVRVAGSWIAAIAILMLGWSFAG